METTAMTNNDVVVDFFVSLGITSERGGTNDFFFIFFFLPLRYVSLRDCEKKEDRKRNDIRMQRELRNGSKRYKGKRRRKRASRKEERRGGRGDHCC
jgi:hypothetical protein